MRARALGIGRDDNLPVFIHFLLNQRSTRRDLFDADAQLSRGFRKRGRYWRGQLKYRFIRHQEFDVATNEGERCKPKAVQTWYQLLPNMKPWPPTKILSRADHSLKFKVPDSPGR